MRCPRRTRQDGVRGREAADKTKTAAVGVRIFHISKVCPHPQNRTPPSPSPRLAPHHHYTRAQVRSVIFCEDCQRSRLLYSMAKPSVALLKRFYTPPLIHSSDITRVNHGFVKAYTPFPPSSLHLHNRVHYALITELERTKPSKNHN